MDLCPNQKLDIIILQTQLCTQGGPKFIGLHKNHSEKIENDDGRKLFRRKRMAGLTLSTKKNNDREMI